MGSRLENTRNVDFSVYTLLYEVKELIPPKKSMESFRTEVIFKVCLIELNSFDQ